MQAIVSNLKKQSHYMVTEILLASRATAFCKNDITSIDLTFLFIDALNLPSTENIFPVLAAKTSSADKYHSSLFPRCVVFMMSLLLFPFLILFLFLILFSS